LRWLQRGYTRTLRRIVRTPRPAFFSVFALVLIGLSVLPFFGESLFPKFKERSFLMHWIAKPGTTHDEVVRITSRPSRDLRAIPGVRTFGSHIGRAVQGEEISGINFAENWITIDPSVDYDSTLTRVEETLNNYPGIYHNVETYLNERIDEVLAGSSNPITV